MNHGKRSTWDNPVGCTSVFLAVLALSLAVAMVSGQRAQEARLHRSDPVRAQAVFPEPSSTEVGLEGQVDLETLHSDLVRLTEAIEEGNRLTEQALERFDRVQWPSTWKGQPNSQPPAGAP